MRPPSAATVLFRPDIVVEVSSNEALLLRENEIESGMQDGRKGNEDNSEEIAWYLRHVALALIHVCQQAHG